MFLSIGGIEQWIEVSGHEPSRPVLLYLHGGPGGSSRPAISAWKAWEDHFTLIHWDQRGSGRTFARNGEAGTGALSIERLVADAIELVEYLRRHLGKDKVLIVGHSFGSVLGVNLAKRRPDLISAYVGTGQLVNKRRNEECNFARLLAAAKETGNAEAVEALSRLVPPLHMDRTAVRVLRDWADRLVRGDTDDVRMRPAPLHPGFTPEDVADLQRGAVFSREQLFDELAATDLPALGLEFETPVIFLHGSEDQQTPIELAEEYFNSIIAPEKAFVRFPGCHHFVVTNRPEDFLDALLTHVRPLVE